MLATLLASPLVTYGFTAVVGLAAYPAVHAVVSKIGTSATNDLTAAQAALEARVTALEAKLPKV